MSRLVARLSQRMQHWFASPPPPPPPSRFRPPVTFRMTVVDLIRRFGARRVAEIGVWKGELTRKILRETEVDYLLLVDPLEATRNCFAVTSRAPHPPMMQTGVYHCDMGEPPLTQDELDRLHAEMTEELERDFPRRTTFLRQPSLDAARVVPDGSLDFVFIDAIHLYEDALADIAAWRPKLQPDGILAGHDYALEFRGVMRAVDESIPPRALHVEPDTNVWFVHNRDLVNGVDYPLAPRRGLSVASC